MAKKKVTGDYYAIKVLHKADMISKNQITNVKAECMILMKQVEPPFVVKLYCTFQSKDNLYLVMEYLNGGDCAALIKAVGSLPEECVTDRLNLRGLRTRVNVNSLRTLALRRIQEGRGKGTGVRTG